MNYLGKHEEERPVYEKSLNAAETYIESQKDPVVTVKKVWEDVARRAKLEHFENRLLAGFYGAVDADKRFQIIPARNEDDISGYGHSGWNPGCRLRGRGNGTARLFLGRPRTSQIRSGYAQCGR